LISECAETFGSQCIVVAIDARRRDIGRPEDGWEVYTHGGRRKVGLDGIEWARRAEASGAGEILLTSMDRDGTRDGYDIELTRAVSDAVRIPVIASGGIFDAESAREKFQAGARLIQLYTGLVYRGPQLLREIMDRL